MLITYYILFTVIIYSGSSDDCLTYTFDEDFPELFVDDLVGCTNHQWTRLQWSHEEYSNSTIPPPNENSKWFITPPGGFSCTSSFLFTMTPGGLLEVLTYRETTPGNSLSILVHEYGNNRLAARIQVNDPGWQVTKIALSGTTDFEGYITFTGTRTIRSVVIVDSFRYVAPSLDPDECVVYPDDFYTIIPTTTVPVTTTDIPIVTTTDRTDLNGECVKYPFEEDYEKLFAKNTQCAHMFGVETSWSHYEYSNSTIIPPNGQSNWFISPSRSYSCVSSFNFTMMSDGLIEIHAYIDAKEQDDYLEVWAHRIVDSHYNNLVGHGFLHAVDHGWHIMSIYLSADTATPFEGFIMFTGLSNPNSVVIVDSFRYVAPSLDPEECILYQDPSTTAPKPTEPTVPTTTDGIPLTTTDISTVTTTDGPSLTTTDATDVESNKTLEKVIIIKKIKTIRIESTVIKKVFRLNNK